MLFFSGIGNGMRAILTAVEYSDLLAITLPYNRHHFQQVTVVTSKADAPNVIPICVANGVGVVVTDLFYERGASFNKWAALEHGLDVIGRHGWLCVMDADVLWPKGLRWKEEGGWLILAEFQDYLGQWNLLNIAFAPGQLVTPRRRMMDSWPHNPLPIRSTDWMPDDSGPRMPGEQHWGEFPLHRNDAEFAGYSQVFYADDPVLRACGNCRCPKEHHRDYHNEASYCHGNCPGTCPGFAWHDTRWKHAGGADSFFQARWSQAMKVRPPFEVLHLGPAGKNWYGRASLLADGSLPPEAGERTRLVGKIWEGRRGKVGDDRFRGEKLD